MQAIIKAVEKAFLTKNGETKFGAGDTVAVSSKIQEGNKTRIQIYQGVVIKREGAGTSASFTVRKASTNSIYVERVFPLHSPLIEEIKVLKRGRVRRAKLYYLRALTGKATRIKEAK